VPTPSATPSLAIVLMGVAGSGKTVVGELLAEKLGVPFLDGDDFHPAANVDKMASGVPLDDADRWPWLDAVGAAVKNAPAPKLVVACSALKRAYRARLAEAAGRPLLFVLLDASRETLARRLAGRRGHFMPASLLDSQLKTLEPPGPSEKAIVVSAEATHVKVAEAVIDALSRVSFAG
jgi:gluconokinase